MRKILIALFVMIIVLVVADRIALLIAERKISDRVASAYDLPAKPGVSIAGFPFLTQVVAGKYHSVDIRVRSVTADGVPVTGLGTLPLHLKVTSVRVEPAGLRISAAGQDVHFAATG
jgi:hypothetical protein